MTVACAEALREITAVEELYGAHLAPLAAMLLRAESVASSKIERIEASVDDYARALHGIRSNPSATSMVASTQALSSLIGSVADGTELKLAEVLEAHRALMLDDPHEKAYAGQLRDMQNWIGGSDWSPRGALYVPPPPTLVADCLRDLLAFANRRDVPVMDQAAIVHAQFESIHPFTDGNGRIGRALINTVFRRRGATRRVVIPLASSVVAQRAGYFAALGSYRDGDASPLIQAFAQASMIAAQEARISAVRLAELPQRWQDEAGGPRRNSAASTSSPGSPTTRSSRLRMLRPRSVAQPRASMPPSSGCTSRGFCDRSLTGLETRSGRRPPWSTSSKTSASGSPPAPPGDARYRLLAACSSSATGSVS